MPDETAPVPVSIEEETIFCGPFTLDQIHWIGGGLLVILLLLAVRDFMFARKKWAVPFLFLLRSVACAGILLALSAPAKMTRRVFETGKNSIGIFLDTSASMSLSDPPDGEGHAARWDLAAGGGKRNSILGEVDEALARLEVARVLLADYPKSDDGKKAATRLLREQLEKALSRIESRTLPYPDLVEDIRGTLRERIQSIEGAAVPSKKVESLRSELFETTRRIAVIGQELARREEDKPDPAEGEEALPSRLELAGQLLRGIEGSVLADMDPEKLGVRRFHFSDRVSPAESRWRVPPESPGESFTNLNSVLDQIASQHRSGQIDAAFLLTDAVNNDSGGETLSIPPGLKDFPLFIIPAGGDYQMSDVTLWSATAPPTVHQGEFLSVECLVGARGFSGKTTEVRLLEDGEVLDSAEVTFDEKGSDEKVRLTTRVKTAGTRRFEVEVAQLPGELHEDNNREYFEVSVFTGDLRVLLVDGWPRWETRYLSNLLKRDKKIEHREILFAPEPPATYPFVLSSAEELGSYPVVVLGEVGPEFLGASELDAFEKYVNGGGNLVVLAGSEYMPSNYRKTQLADLLPVMLDRPRAQLEKRIQLVPSAAGNQIAALSLEDSKAQNEAVWRLSSGLLSLANLSPFNQPKPAAQVILEARPVQGTPGESLPYIVWHRYGAGRVFYFTSPTTHHLRYRFGDRYHYRFWGQFFRWATTAEMHRNHAMIYLDTDAKRYRENESPTMEIELRDRSGEPVKGAKIGIDLTSGRGGESKRYQCAEVAGRDGIYSLTLPPLKYGEYRAEVVGPAVGQLKNEIEKDDEKGVLKPRAVFVVEAPPNRELGDRTCHWAAIDQLIEGTAGALIPPETMETAIEVFSERHATVSREETEEEPLWNRWSLFFFILLFLTAEWIGRKFAGLI